MSLISVFVQALLICTVSMLAAEDGQVSVIALLGRKQIHNNARHETSA